MSNPNFADKSGQAVPECTFAARVNDEWVKITTDELFKGKTVVVFSLPWRFYSYLFFYSFTSLQ